MVTGPRLIIQLARGSAVDRQLSEQPPQSVTSGEVVVSHAPADAAGVLEPIAAGEVVLSVPSPEALERAADEVRRVIAQAGAGNEPLIVVVEAAEELRDSELAAILEAAEHASRGLILRIVRDP